MYQNNEMAAILVYGTGISSFLFKYFVLFHHPTGATDHVSENDLLNTGFSFSPVFCIRPETIFNLVIVVDAITGIICILFTIKLPTQ